MQRSKTSYDLEIFRHGGTLKFLFENIHVDVSQI